jgi:hypothetical protein
LGSVLSVSSVGDSGYRIPAPLDGYLRELGRLVHNVGYVEWLMFDVMRRIDPEMELDELAGETLGRAVKRFDSAARGGRLPPDAALLVRAASDEVRVLHERYHNDILHARPATADSVLYRWAPTLTDHPRFITRDDIVDGIRACERCVDALNALRTALG